MTQTRDVELARSHAEITVLQECERALVCLAQRRCTAKREEAESELARVRSAISSAYARRDKSEETIQEDRVTCRLVIPVWIAT